VAAVVVGLVLGAAAAAPAAVEIKLANNFPVTHTVTRSDELFAKLVAEKSKGEVLIRVFPANQLGGGKQIYEQMRLGAIQMNHHGLPEFKDLDLLFLPYLFQDAEHAQRVFGSPIARGWAEKSVREKGVRPLNMSSRGFRHIVMRNRPVRTFDEFKGVRIRSPENPTMVASFKAMGMNPVPLPWPDTYNAMLLGTIDAMENAAEQLNASKFYEVGKYLVLTYHMLTPAFLFINERFYQGLAPAHRKAVDEAAEEAMAWFAKESARLDVEDVQKLKDKGMTLIEVDLKPFREATKDLYKAHAEPVWGKGVYEEIKAMAR
jgi:tripartite ATP-independent transporter DctP family solute receptor